MATLNLGILAHVDAGKTSLTERLLHAAGVIDEIGRVDAGTTRTDTLELERARGITIKSAVVSFVIDDGLTVNLIDTPGHPDFIAEVERILDVLDAVVLVVSAVEGVQSQTRILMRTLQRLRIPTLLFVNKIDRVGARDETVLAQIVDKLTPAIVPMGATRDLGTRDADFVPCDPTSGDAIARLLDLLSGHDDELMAAYVDDESAVSHARLRVALAAQTRQAQVHPVFFGSAVTGAGVDALMGGVRDLLPTAEPDVDGPASGTVFKIDRGPAGEKIAYVRMFAGTIRVRDRVRFGGQDAKLTAIRVFDRGTAARRASVAAGNIGLLWGLGDVRIGDVIGSVPTRKRKQHFAPPTLQTVVEPRRAPDNGALHVALTQLAEQDPLIDVRHDDRRGELSVSLYGEVQKEVLQATLAENYGLAVRFRESSPICVERPAGRGEAVEVLNAESNPFRATVGLRVEPAAPGSGFEFRLRVDSRSVPMYLYRSTDNFAEMMRQYVRRALREGRHGWEVTDCTVTMVDCNYSSPDGPPSTRGPLSTLADFRDLTPLVVMQALESAGVRVCEPIHRFRLDAPADRLGAVLSVLSRLGAVPEATSVRGSVCILRGDVPAAQVHRLRQRLPALTHGEGVLESAFHRHRPIRGAPPSRSRIGPDPLDRKEYLHHLRRRL